MKEIKAKIEFISPIHIGSEEAITPMDYFIKDKKLQKVNYNIFISSLDSTQRSNLMDLLDRVDTIALRNFAEKNAKPEVIEYSIPVSSKVAKEYNEKKQGEQNKLEISLFPYDGVTRHPYIPGSSIKGAFRTAILESLIQKLPENEVKDWIQETKRDQTGNQLEGKILGYDRDIHRDVFRVLKVFDIPLTSEDTEIVQCENFSLKRKSGIPMRLQVTKSRISEIGKMFQKELTIVWDEKLLQSSIEKKNNKESLFQKTFTLQELGNACNEHYFKVLFWEYKKFYKSQADQTLKILENLYDTLAQNQFLIRLGRFGHVESKTFDTYRQPKAKKGWGKSRTKANETYPLGWAIITIQDMVFTKPTKETLEKWEPTGANSQTSNQDKQQRHQGTNPNKQSQHQNKHPQNPKANNPNQPSRYSPFQKHFQKGK